MRFRIVRKYTGGLIQLLRIECASHRITRRVGNRSCAFVIVKYARKRVQTAAGLNQTAQNHLTRARGYMILRGILCHYSRPLRFHSAPAPKISQANNNNLRSSSPAGADHLSTALIKIALRVIAFQRLTVAYWMLSVPVHRRLKCLWNSKLFRSV